MIGSQRNTYGGGAKLIYDTRKLQLTSDLQVGFTDTKDSPYGNFSTYTQLLPIFRIKDSNGDYFPTLSANNIPLYENFPWTGIGSDVLGSQINPLYEANNLNNFSRGNNLSLTYQLGANWEIVKDLRLRASFTYDRMESMTEKYVSPFSSAITDGLENNSVEQLYRRGSYDKQNTTTSKYYGMVNLSYLILTGLLNPFGVSVAAAAGIGLKVSTFAGMPCWALGYGVTAMVGQNLGAGDPDRVRQTVRSGLLLSLGATALLTALVQLAAAPIIALFEPENAAVTAEGVRYLRICCSVNGLIYAAMYVFDSFAIGSGASWVAMCNAMLDAALLRLPLCWLLAFPLALGPAGIYLGQAFSPILPALAGLCYFRLRCRRS